MWSWLLRLVGPWYLGWSALAYFPLFWRGSGRWRRRICHATNLGNSPAEPSVRPSNPLEQYFDRVQAGPGIWKWRHYFEIYHKHFQQFRGREVHIVEIGVYSGGSLGLWTDYFGPNCHVYGIDIEPACKAYERDGVRVFVGDQADRQFWRGFKEQVPRVDIVIDDGGHKTRQQIVTFEELFPHLAPGGVYLCEDVAFSNNFFAQYMCGVSQNLHAFERYQNSDDNERRLSCPASDFQAWVEAIHFYPYVVVAEKRESPRAEFVAPKHGTIWEPFLK